jgi:hypothetical protein
MTVDNIHEAIESHRRFQIQMADGRKYEVPHPDFISFTRKRTAVLVSLENERVQMLPLITMTGITYTPKRNGKER